MPQLVAAGEALIQFNAVSRGPLRHAVLFEKHVAGAEANVAVCASRQDVSSGFIGRVGNDEFGRCIVSWLRGEGVDVSQVKMDRSAQTGIYFVQRGFPVPDRSKMIYYRSGSAGSRLSPEDIDESFVSSAKVIHLTGITPALSKSALEASRKMVEVAKENNILCSFDTNIRPTLWQSTDEAAKELRFFVERADILFVDPTDASILIGERDPKKAIDAFRRLGIETVVMKYSGRYAEAVNSREQASATAAEVYVEDPIGAGDAFAGTFISCVTKRMKLGESLQKAMMAGTLVVTVRGDQENLPSSEDLDTNLHT